MSIEIGSFRSRAVDRFEGLKIVWLVLVGCARFGDKGQGGRCVCWGGAEGEGQS